MPEINQNKKIKVLHIITRLDIGGSSTNTIETVARLDKDKYEAFLIFGKTHDPDKQIENFLKEKKISYLLIDDLQREINLWQDLKALFKLYKEIKGRKYDIVHTHSSKAGMLGRWAAWFAKTKYIVHTPHGHVFYGYFGPIKTKIFIILERLTSIITDKIITLTKFGKEDHIKYKIAKPDKFVPIYSGINVGNFKNVCSDSYKLRTEFNIPNDSTVVGSIARLDPIKGNEYLVDAFVKVINEYHNAYLILVGDGVQRSYLEQKTQNLGIKENVIFAGFRKDVPELLTILNIFVLPSINEGMGRSILEAMACGIPVIATKTGGIPELVEDNEDGFLVPIKDSGSLANAILNLIKNPDKAKRFSERGRIKVNDKFSIEKMVKDIEGLYEGIKKS